MAHLSRSLFLQSAPPLKDGKNRDQPRPALSGLKAFRITDPKARTGYTAWPLPCQITSAPVATVGYGPVDISVGANAPVDMINRSVR
jgi:hypothetical protein